MAGQGFSPVRRTVPNRKYATSRSVRISDPVWEKARRRAALDGYKMSAVIQLLVEAYANGLIDTPKIQLAYKRKKVTDGDDAG